jgi:hypothetical protein
MTWRKGRHTISRPTRLRRWPATALTLSLLASVAPGALAQSGSGGSTGGSQPKDILATIASGLLGGVAGALASLVISYFTRFRERDKAVHTTRLEVYVALVQELAPLALFFPSVAQSDNPSSCSYILTPQICLEMGTKLCKWYFRGGGILLSDNSREAYFYLLGLLREHRRKVLSSYMLLHFLVSTLQLATDWLMTIERHLAFPRT